MNLKGLTEVKAEELTAKRLDQWLSGDISRRILVVPFGGPLPGGKAGLDLDGEFFDEETDLYGPFPMLRQTRERIVDWHHDDAGVKGRASKMKGADLGRINLDEDPEDDGYWADWWTNVGEDRRKLIASLERRGTPLYGSSQAVFKTKADTGHIEVWPLYRHTITTSPQNTYAVVPPLKAVLDGLHFDDLTNDAIKAFLVGLDAIVPDLRATFHGDGEDLSASGGETVAKAGRVLSAANESQLRAAIEALSLVLSKLDLPLEELSNG